MQIEHLNLKHPQMVGVVERSAHLNVFSNWIQLATFFHIMSNHSSIACLPTVLFHGREPIKSLDLRFKNTLIERFSANSEYLSE